MVGMVIDATEAGRVGWAWAPAIPGARLGRIDLLGEITGDGRYEDLLPHVLVVKRAARPEDLERIAALEASAEESEQKTR